MKEKSTLNYNPTVGSIFGRGFFNLLGDFPIYRAMLLTFVCLFVFVFVFFVLRTHRQMPRRLMQQLYAYTANNAVPLVHEMFAAKYQEDKQTALYRLLLKLSY